MTRNRSHHADAARRKRLRTWLAAAAAALVVATVVVGVAALRSPRASAPIQTEPLSASNSATQTASVAGSSTDSSATVSVEMPALVDRTLAEARVLLDAMGVTVSVEHDPALPIDAMGDARMVARQQPAAGTLLAPGAAVTVVVAGADERAKTVSGVVVIDPGHQSRGDSAPEPIGPGSSQTKPRVTGGTTGIETRIPEYEVVLQIATNLQARLEAAGVTVVMTRTTNDVNISNAERAAVANEAGADLFLRIHADGDVDSTQAGISTLYPAKNQWAGPIASRSLVAATSLHGAVIASTGAASRGMVARGDLSGFNWSRVPAVLVECGFLTNPVEDRLLTSPHYQDKLAEGMAAGIVEFLGQ